MANTDGANSMFSFGEDASYSTHMAPSQKVLSFFTKDILSFIGDITENSEKETFTMADFGTADGGISLRLFNLIIDEINKYDSGKQVCVVYEDQQFNDFNKLFRRINGLIPESTDIINQGENVFVLASGTTMYKQCLPSSSIDFAFSSMANQWLSKRPCFIKNGLFQALATNEELKQIRQQSAIDWKQFLICRGKELRKGGCLFVISFITDEDGEGNEYIGKNSHETLSSIWKEMMLEGKISQEEFQNNNKNTFNPSVDDLKAPFLSNEKEFQRLGLLLVSCQVQHIKVMEQMKEESRDDFVIKVLRSIQSWLYNTLFNALSKDRTREERTALVEEYFQRLKSLMLSDCCQCDPVVYKVAGLHIMKL